MPRNRRSLLQSVGVTGFGLTGLSLLSQDAKSIDLGKGTVQKMLSTYPSKSKSDFEYEPEEGKEDKPENAEKIYTHGSELRVLNIFKGSDYGWQARVAVTGGAQDRSRDPSIRNDWYPSKSLTFSKVEAINTDPFGEYQPQFDDQFQGYYPENDNPGDLEVPDWAQPAINTVGTVLIGSVAPELGTIASIGLGASQVLGELQPSTGEESFTTGDSELGFREKYAPKRDFPYDFLPVRSADMAHYQRITGRFGEYLGSGDNQMKVRSVFNGGRAKKVKTEYGVQVISEDQGEINSLTGVRPENWSTEKKERYGYVSVDKTTPQNLSRSNTQINEYIERLNKSVDEEEVVAVLLDPPIKIE